MDNVRRSARKVLVAQAGVLILTLWLLAAIGAGLLDYTVRSPDWLRIIGLAGSAAGLVWLVRRWLLPAARFSPPLSAIALRLESRQAAVDAGLKHRLASGIEFANEKSSFAKSAAAEAAQRFHPSVVRDVVRTVHLRRRIGALALTLGFVAIVGFWQPALLATGVSRVLTPWAGASWPKRTAIVDATNRTVHPSGEALPIRAALTRSRRAPADTDVALRYRIVSDNGTGPLRRTLLTHQDRSVLVDAPTASRSSVADKTEGQLFERLLEPPEFVGEQASLEYWLETEDDRSPTQTITLVVPPEVVSASAIITPPAYAADAPLEGAWVGGDTDLGSGRDERSLAGPVLAGSMIELTIELSKTVPGIDGDQSSWARDALGEDAARIEDLSLRSDGATITASWIAQSSSRLDVRPADEFGLRAMERSVFGFDVVSDAEPGVAIIDPVRDEAVLATAVVEIIAEGRDDVGLASVWLESQRATPPTDGEGNRSSGASAEAQGEPIEFARTDSQTSQTNSSVGLRAELKSSLDLAPLGLRPGDELRITAFATDLRGEDRSESPTRVLSIISESELIDRLLAELGAVRRAAISTDREQADVMERADQEQASARRDAQARITGRLSGMLETFERAEERVERNGLDDTSLRELIRDGASAARAAAAASAQASRSLDEQAEQEQAEIEADQEPGDDAQQNDEQNEQQQADQAEQTEEAQEDVRQELERLARLLDQGEDAWAVRRSLESLIAEQEQLAQETARAGQATSGRPMSDLTPAELTELDRIAQRQLELADQAEQVLDELDERADAIEESDEGQAAAMRSAAQSGRQAGVPSGMSQASQNVGENQTAEAGQQQQEALEAMGEMLQSLDDADTQRREALKRRLASMSESVQNLIRMQENELDQLDQRLDPNELSKGMARLHRATISVHAESLAAEELADASELLDDASDEQADAAGDLRVVPALLDDALESEQDSLRLLNEALEEINRLQEETERDDVRQRRAELKRAYAELLELQSVLRDDTSRFDIPRLTRRDRADVRALGRRQATLRDRTTQLGTETEGLGESDSFALAHQRLDLIQTSASDRLNKAQGVKRATLEQASTVRLLRGLVDALTDDENEEDFEEGGGGGGGGGGEAEPEPLVPPIAELKLLRAMQEEALTLTRLANDTNGEEINAEELVTLQQELLELGRAMIEKTQGGPPDSADLQEIEISPEASEPISEPDPESEDDAAGGGS